MVEQENMTCHTFLLQMLQRPGQPIKFLTIFTYTRKTHTGTWHSDSQSTAVGVQALFDAEQLCERLNPKRGGPSRMPFGGLWLAGGGLRATGRGMKT